MQITSARVRACVWVLACVFGRYWGGRKMRYMLQLASKKKKKSEVDNPNAGHVSCT